LTFVAQENENVKEGKKKREVRKRNKCRALKGKQNESRRTDSKTLIG